ADTSRTRQVGSQQSGRPVGIGDTDFVGIEFDPPDQLGFPGRADLPLPAGRGAPGHGGQTAHSFGSERSSGTGDSFRMTPFRPHGAAGLGVGISRAGSVAHSRLWHQCRKWRAPVKTITTPYRLQTAMASASRREPPGWMIAFTPAAASASGPSGI